MSDPGLEKAGWVKHLTDILDHEKLDWVYYSDVVSNPRDSQIEKGAVVYRENAADVVIALGGGSPMDAAKVIALVASNGGRIHDYEGANRINRPLPPMVFVPSTAGSGSGISQFAIITDVQRRVKMSIISRTLVPNISIDFLVEHQAPCRGGSRSGRRVRCSGTYHDKDGHYLTKQPEYETVWAHGGHCGICDLDAIARLDFLDDNIGLDTIEMGVTIGIAMEAGLLKFGDAAGAVRLIVEVGKGTPLGRILGSGAAVTGKTFGVERVPVVKGQALPAYDPRAVQGIGVTYATSTMGADHTAGYAVATNILKVGGDVDPLKPEGQIELSRNLQIATAAIDATGMCLFIAFAVLDQPDTFQALLDMLNAFYGLSLDADGVGELGKTILKAEREFNKRAGFSAQHDRLPRFFTTDSVGPHNVTFNVTDQQLDELYNW